MTDRDERWERMLRAADPARTAADAPLGLAQTALRERIAASASTVRPERRRAWIGIATPLAAVAALVIALVIVLPLGTAPAAAYGPRPLVYRELPLSADEIVEHAVGQLTAAPSEGRAERRSRVTSWSLGFSPDASPEKQLVISPYVQELEWSEDLSGSIRLWAGRPFYADGPTDRIPDDVEYAPGELVSEERFGPGEYVPVFPELRERGVVESITQEGYLAAGATPGDIVLMTQSVQMEWTLSDGEQAELLTLIGGQGELTVLGATQDRLGRDAIALASVAAVDPHARQILLISARTGRIIGVEAVALGTNEHLPVPEGTVTSYMLWEERG